LRPEWLAGLAVLWCLLAGATLMSLLWARRRLQRLRASGPAVAGIAGDTLRLLALLAICVALLGPRIGTRSERVSTSGVDVVVLMDVSTSMDARDLPPSRLDRARQTATALLAGLEAGDRAALAAFAGRGVLLTPLTLDHDALAELIPALDTSLIQPASSRLGAGVVEALQAFDPGSDRPRVLVVLSDGEDVEGGTDLGVAACNRAGVRVVGVALGTEAGATIPRLGLELRDRHGRIVTTRLDAARLGRLTEASDGPLLRPDALGAVDVPSLLRAVRRDAPPPGRGGVTLRSVPAVRVAPFALAALGLLALEAALRASRATPGLVALLVGGLALGAHGAERAARPPVHDAAALLSRGLALAAQGQWPTAEHAFFAAALEARDPALAAEAYHDAGVAALRNRHLAAARTAFFESLAAQPDPRTRFNLEWTLRALEAAEPPPTEGSAGTAGEAEKQAPEPAGDEAAQGATEAPAAAQPDSAHPEPSETRAASRSAGLGPQVPPPLTAEEAERWLDRTGDDAARALRGLGGPGRRGAPGPAW